MESNRQSYGVTGGSCEWVDGMKADSNIISSLFTFQSVNQLEI